MSKWEVRQGDALELLRGMPENSADLVFADPPYGVNKAAWDSDFSLNWLEDCARISRRFTVVTPGISNLLKMPQETSSARFVWVTSCWIANSRMRGALGFGHWIAAVVYCRNGESPYIQSPDFTRVTISGQMPDHPSPKPPGFMYWIVDKFSPKDGCVLDPFTGSGSTGVACAELGRDFLGFEIDETYCALARRRIGAAQPALAMA